jgi:ABC-2 type transport system ATP-binding protein
MTDSSDDLDRGQIVSAVGVGRSFGGQPALEHVDLDVPPATILGLIGPSGCGKTTLIRILTGTLRRDEGEVRVLGVDPERFTSRDRARFGYMPQLPVHFPNLSMRSNVNFMASMYGVPLRGRRRRVRRVLEFVDLWADRAKRTSAGSGGMQRRLALAATLVHEPDLLFLDEPTTGIDPVLRGRFWDGFRALRDGGRTIVVSTQYVGEAASCDLVAVMIDGRVLLVDTPEALRHRAVGGDTVVVQLDGQAVVAAQLEHLRRLPFVVDVARRDDGLEVVVKDSASDMSGLAEHFASEQVPVGRMELTVPDFDDVFVALVDAANERPSTAMVRP